MRKIIGLTVAVLLSAVSASAITTCGAQGAATLADLIALGSDGCQVGDKIFSNFDYKVVSASGGSSVPTPAQITIAPLSPNPLVLGLLFGVPFSVTNGTLDVQLAYTVTHVSGVATIKDAELGIGGVAVTGQSTVSVAEDLCLGGVFNPKLSSLCQGGVYLPASPNGLSVVVTAQGGALTPNPDSVVFDPVPQVGVFKDIMLDAPGSTSYAAFSSMTQTWSQVPEPATYGLLGGGLLVLGLIGRRLRKA